MGPTGPRWAPMLAPWTLLSEQWNWTTELAWPSVTHEDFNQSLAPFFFTDDKILNMRAHILPLVYVHSILTIRCIWYFIGITKQTLYAAQQHQVIQRQCFKVDCYSILDGCLLCSPNKAIQDISCPKWNQYKPLLGLYLLHILNMYHQVWLHTV